jgi:hypothetical protein
MALIAVYAILALNWPVLAASQTCDFTPGVHAKAEYTGVRTQHRNPIFFDSILGSKLMICRLAPSKELMLEEPA